MPRLSLLDIRTIATDLDLKVNQNPYTDAISIRHPMDGNSQQDRILKDRAFKAVQDILFHNSIFYKIEQDDFWIGELSIVVESTHQVGPFVQPACPLSTTKFDVKALRELAMRGNLGTHQDSTHFFIQKSWNNVDQIKGFKYVQTILSRFNIRYSIKYDPEDFYCCYLCVPLCELEQRENV